MKDARERPAVEPPDTIKSTCKVRGGSKYRYRRFLQAGDDAFHPSHNNRIIRSHNLNVRIFPFQTRFNVIHTVYTIELRTFTITEINEGGEFGPLDTKRARLILLLTLLERRPPDPP